MWKANSSLTAEWCIRLKIISYSFWHRSECSQICESVHLCILAWAASYVARKTMKLSSFSGYFRQLGHRLDMVYLPPPPPPPPVGSFVDHIFLEAQCLARILQHVSPLTMAALSCYSLSYTLPYKRFHSYLSF